jgi:hypothetical protein
MRQEEEGEEVDTQNYIISTFLSKLIFIIAE